MRRIRPCCHTLLAAALVLAGMAPITGALAQSPATDTPLAIRDLTRYFPNAEAQAQALKVCQTEANARGTEPPTDAAKR